MKLQPAEPTDAPNLMIGISISGLPVCRNCWKFSFWGVATPRLVHIVLPGGCWCGRCHTKTRFAEVAVGDVLLAVTDDMEQSTSFCIVLQYALLVVINIMLDTSSRVKPGVGPLSPADVVKRVNQLRVQDR